VQDAVKKTCECFDIDPYVAISEGTLLATARPEKADAVVAALQSEGIPASVVGEIVPESEGIHTVENGTKRRLEHPRVDPFWIRFEEYLGKQSG
jgi:hydrogenase expression/formation protein HypE